MKRLYKKLDKWMGHIPSSTRYHMMHKQARKRFYEYMRQEMGHFIVEVDPDPVGDKEIILRTAILHQEDISRRTNPDYYFASGYDHMRAWLQHLKHYSFNIRTVRAIMELGCGSARSIRHLRCVDGIRLVGSDVNQDFINWCRNNVPGIEFYCNDLRPPLQFAENDSFDLVFAESVFTHIPLELQGLWIEELCRVLRPGGFLLASVTGRFHQLQLLTTEERALLKKDKHFTLDSTNNRASYSTQVIGSWDIFQTRDEVLKAFGSVFRVLDYTPGPLDLLTLQKSTRHT